MLEKEIRATLPGDSPSPYTQPETLGGKVTTTQDDARESEVPRSFSKTITTYRDDHAASTARCLADGAVIPSILSDAVEQPRLATSTVEKKISSRILENSAAN